jgi:hypothetical protein
VGSTVSRLKLIDPTAGAGGRPKGPAIDGCLDGPAIEAEPLRQYFRGVFPDTRRTDYGVGLKIIEAYGTGDEANFPRRWVLDRADDATLDQLRSFTNFRDSLDLAARNSSLAE